MILTASPEFLQKLEFAIETNEPTDCASMIKGLLIKVTEDTLIVQAYIEVYHILDKLSIKVVDTI